MNICYFCIMISNNASGTSHQYNELQLIKRRFYAMRNGILADSLRKAGVDYPVIFGLNLPQITEIANAQRCRRELAETLWADTRCRESRLMAPMVFPVEDMSREDACRWLTGCANVETADILCHRLLRRHPQGVEIAMSHGYDADPLVRYAALRLMLNILAVSDDKCRAAAKFSEYTDIAPDAPRPLRTVGRQLAEEIGWIMEDEDMTARTHDK